METLNMEEELSQVTGGAQNLSGKQNSKNSSSAASSVCPKGGEHEWIRIDSTMSKCAKCNLFITV